MFRRSSRDHARRHRRDRSRAMRRSTAKPRRAVLMRAMPVRAFGFASSPSSHSASSISGSIAACRRRRRVRSSIRIDVEASASDRRVAEFAGLQRAPRCSRWRTGLGRRAPRRLVRIDGRHREDDRARRVGTRQHKLGVDQARVGSAFGRVAVNRCACRPSSAHRPARSSRREPHAACGTELRHHVRLGSCCRRYIAMAAR